MANFEIFLDEQGNYRWRFQANNGNIMAKSAESFVNRANCEHSILLLKQQSPKASTSVELKVNDQVKKAIVK